METVAIITAGKDVLLGGAAAVTAIVAVVGLQNWRRELKGRTEFETAFRFIKSAYKLRDELNICRSPLIRMHEFPEGYAGSNVQNTAEENAQAWAYVYKNRWEPVWSAVQDFDAAEYGQALETTFKNSVLTRTAGANGTECAACVPPKVHGRHTWCRPIPPESFRSNMLWNSYVVKAVLPIAV